MAAYSGEERLAVFGGLHLLVMAEHFVLNSGTDKVRVECRLLYFKRGVSLCMSPQRSAYRGDVSVAGCRDVDRLTWKSGGLVLAR